MHYWVVLVEVNAVQLLLIFLQKISKMVEKKRKKTGSLLIFILLTHFKVFTRPYNAPPHIIFLHFASQYPHS